MKSLPPIPEEPGEPVDWRKNRKLERAGFEDLVYLPRSYAGWNATLAACAYSARRRAEGSADLSLWAVMHGCAASARYEELGDDALVLWHGTSAARAEKIREVGLIHKRGVWTTEDPNTAHGYTRGRSMQYQAGSAMVVLVMSRREWEGLAEREGNSDVLRFRTNIPRECLEYVLWDDHIEFVGPQRAKQPRPWGVARFKRQEGKWVPRAQPPVRLDEEHSYADFEGWLRLSFERIFRTLDTAAAIEVFASLYSTLDPWHALEHKRVLAALEEWCDPPKRARGGVPRFSASTGGEEA